MKTEPAGVESRHALCISHLHRAPTEMPILERISLLRAICAALLLAQLTACMASRPVQLDQQVGAAPLPHARVILRDGSELPLAEVTVRADSVIGYSEGTGERRARSVADVASITRNTFSLARTGGAIGGLYLLGALVTLLTLASAGY